MFGNLKIVRVKFSHSICACSKRTFFSVHVCVCVCMYIYVLGAVLKIFIQTMANQKNLNDTKNFSNDITMEISTNSTYNDDCTSNHANYFDDQSDSSIMQDEYQCIEEFEKKLDFFNELINYKKEIATKFDSSKKIVFTDRFRPPGILIFSILYKSIKINLC